MVDPEPIPRTLCVRNSPWMGYQSITQHHKFTPNSNFPVVWGCAKKSEETHGDNGATNETPDSSLRSGSINYRAIAIDS